MARAKPVEVVHQTYGPQFNRLCVMAQRYWNRNVLPFDENSPVIFVELLMQDVRVAVRNLTTANAIRRVQPARMVAIVGPDPGWKNTVWQYYRADIMEKLARGYGADEVINLADLTAGMADGSVTELTIGDRSVPIPESSSIDPGLYDDILDATAVRVLRVPRATEEVRETEEYAEVVRVSRLYDRFYEALFTGFPAIGYVTSHIDYHQWGLAVDAAIRSKVPVVHVQSTGNLKAYCLFPDKVVGNDTYRMQLTRLIGEYFEENVWRHRHQLRRAAELTAWRAKVNLGRPSWWRGGGAVSQLEFRSQPERAAFRVHAMKRYGLDPNKPVIAVFNHAVSDAVHSNKEIFADLADWFTQTVEYAAAHPEVNWLFMDHPAQAFYDRTEMFERLAAENAENTHMLFRPSMDLSKNTIWSLVDLAVTVRGSVSNEYPAYGIPAVQAGWSEWSHCGFTMRADDQDEYWNILNDSIRRLQAGEELITPEQVERARLWLWYYRCASDVVSPLTPHWESSQKDRFYLAVNVAISHIESEGDPAFVAARRMWRRHEPFLTRNDLTRSSEDLADELGLVTDLAGDEDKADLVHASDYVVKG